MSIYPYLFIAILLFNIPVDSFAQVSTFRVSFNQVDPNYSAEEDSCTISIKPNVHGERLLIFLGGTGSNSESSYNALRLHAASLGIDFINLSYPNSIATVDLAGIDDDLVFDKYRQEIGFGTPISEEVLVDSLNSIYTRSVSLVNYLHTTYPDQGWGNYVLSADSLDWTKIMVGGHSQGAGHACYLSKNIEVNRVVMFSGPNDYSDFLDTAANWLSRPGLTPLSSYYVYHSINDEAVSYTKQYAVINRLGMLANHDTILVDNREPPYNNSSCLYTQQSPGIVLLHHNTPVKLSEINQNVWSYMLTSENTTSLGDISNDLPLFKAFPNPTQEMLTILGSQIVVNGKYRMYNTLGAMVLEGNFNHDGQAFIDVSSLDSGIYFVRAYDQCAKIVKN